MTRRRGRVGRVFDVKYRELFSAKHEAEELSLGVRSFAPYRRRKARFEELSNLNKFEA